MTGGRGQQRRAGRGGAGYGRAAHSRAEQSGKRKASQGRQGRRVGAARQTASVQLVATSLIQEVGGGKRKARHAQRAGREVQEPQHATCPSTITRLHRNGTVRTWPEGGPYLASLQARPNLACISPSGATNHHTGKQAVQELPELHADDSLAGTHSPTGRNVHRAMRSSTRRITGS